MTAAELLVRALYKATEGRCESWKTLTSLDATYETACEAERQGQVVTADDNCVRLTEAGRQFASEFPENEHLPEF